LAVQAAMQRYAEEVRRTEVVVRAIGNDLHIDYSAVGQTTHLAARMEQLATPGSILLTVATLRLVEGFMRVQALGPVPVKGLADPVEVFELVGATALRRRLQAAVARGLSPFVGRQPELEALQQALSWAGAGQGQVVALIGESAVGHYRQALTLAEELGRRPLQVHCHRGLGTLYATIGQQEHARRELSTAIAMYRTLAMTFWLPQAEATLAMVH
jgi:Adenylate and Guanylate cyclase catalytic domain